MPRIRVILESDDGHPLGDSVDEVYLLDSMCDNLSQIETSVEHFKRAALPKIEKRLLQSAQERQIERQKKL